MLRVVSRPMMTKLFIEAHIADIHFGVINPKLQFDILKEQFLYYLEAMPILDIVSINGDIFHHKFMANSDAIMYACYFIEALVDICRRKGATLNILKGTEEHEADQLKLFYPYVKRNGCDIRIVEEVKFEYIKGKRALVIPELYGKGEEYYSKFLFFSGLYDCVYMHGTLVNSIIGKNQADLNSNREPVFSMNHFVNCMGPIVSGHVHTPGCHKSHFYYCGTPIRHSFGEEENKGFMVLLHNTDTREYYTHFESIESFRYDTINLDHMLQENPKNVINYIKQLQSQGIHNIRVKFTMNAEENINIIKSYFRSNGSVNIDADFKNEKVIQDVKSLEEKYKQYDYIYDKGANEYQKLAQFMNNDLGYVYITGEDLESFIKSLY